MSFYVEIIPNRANKPTILLREARREGKRIRKKTLANLSRLPPEVVDGFRTVLRGGLAVQDASQLLASSAPGPTAMSPPSSGPAASSMALN